MLLMDSSNISGLVALGGRMVVPVMLVGLLFVLNIISFSYGPLGVIRAPFFLMALYYWSVFRPSLMPVWFVFLAGILLDLLSGLPVGLNASVFLIARWVVADQRKFLMAQPFMGFWMFFALVAAAAALLQWGLFGLVNWGWTAIKPVALSVALGVTLFPFVSTFIHWTHRLLPAGSSFGP